MNELPLQLYRAEQTRELDRLAMGEFGISGTILMERAGDAAFSVLTTAWPQARRLAVLCGNGNNGGDGFVIARLAHEQGMDVTVYQVGDASKLQGDGLAALQRMMGVDLNPVQFTSRSLDDFDVIVDALLGTGIYGEVRPDFRVAIGAINRSSAAVLAVDVPSGLNADTGMPCGIAVEADHTLTFIGLKQGLLTGEGADYCGELHFDDLNLPPEVFERVRPSACRLLFGSLGMPLKRRRRTAHKGDFGHVLIVGGNAGMGGAVRLAGEAALRTGAGLVSIASREQHAGLLNGNRPELMCHGTETIEQLKALSSRATVIAIGPGLGKDEWAREMVAIAIARNLPLVVDADALKLLARIDITRKDWILTPHPGEAAHLLDTDSQTIQSDRFSAVNRIAQKYNATVVLKGAGTLIGHNGDAIGICTAGNPGMASGGMGDVLTGIIAALLAQGLDEQTAARFGVCLHAEAADLAVRGIGERGLLASDLMAPIRRLVNAG